MSALPSPFPLLPEPPPLTADEEASLGRSAAVALRRHCGGGAPEASQALGGSPSVGENLPGSAETTPERLRSVVGVFVTLLQGEDLRGCLGMVQGDEPLFEAVPRLAVAAATRDTRFDPVKASEVPSLRLEITLLGSLVRLPGDPTVILQYLDPNACGVYLRAQGRSGLLLPQVARRLGWSAGELMEQVSMKAGLAREAWRDTAAVAYGFHARTLKSVPLGGPSC